MSSLINVVLGAIPEPFPEPSLLHPRNISEPVQCRFYMDDIVSGSSSFESAFHFLQHHFLPRILWAGLKLSFKKLKLFVPEIVALGIKHEVGGQLHVKPARIEKIASWPQPQTKKDVRSFLGAVGITRRWVKNFAELARPLSRLTGAYDWKWEDPEKLSFDVLRIKCSTATALQGFDWTQPAHMFTDASHFALGVLIAQNRQDPTRLGHHYYAPILFDSFTLNKSELRYSVYEKELYAIVKAMRKYGHLFLDPTTPGVVHTDHKPLFYFMSADNHIGIYARWVYELRQFNFTIDYIKGKENSVADGLSRTLFYSESCEPSSSITEAKRKMEEEGEKWVWKEGADGFEVFLESLGEKEKEDILQGPGEKVVASVNDITVQA